jgi:hypothetical protein
MSVKLESVYKEKRCTSDVSSCTWSDLDTMIAEISEGWVVYWQYHQVFVGQIEGKLINWLNGVPNPQDQDHLVRLRAFNEEKEFHFWRSGGQIKGRKRVDDGAEGDTSYVETDMVLRSEIALPLKDVFGSDKKFWLVTRNYIGYDDAQQAGYVDSRFVKFL